MAVILTYTISQAGAAPLPVPADEIDRLFGRDVYFDVATNLSDANYEISPAGDWILVEGREALRQAVIRRIITNPGEWALLPDYGVGARLFVKQKDTASSRKELEERIRGQLAQEDRVASVEQVIIERLADGPGLKIAVVIVPAGQTQRVLPLTATTEVT